MNKRWVKQEIETEKIQALQKETGIPEVYCKMLILRGIRNVEEARRFLNPQRTTLHNPFLMKDLDKAVDRINRAVKATEKIMVYGDYDVDGTTSIALVYSFLKDYFPSISVCYYAPDRYQEGYGLSLKGIDNASEQGISLIIVLDCGIKALSQVDYAKIKGIDMIICDHHLPGAELPRACAILNPKQKDCHYPYKELSGCGIGFKLVCGLLQKLGKDTKEADRYLDLVVTSIAADIVPLTGENRIMAILGLKKINQHPAVSIKAILEKCNIRKALNLKDVAFVIAPRINAAGRMEHAEQAIKLLIEKDIAKAGIWADRLENLNEERKKTDQIITDQIIEQITRDPDTRKRNTTVVRGTNWHKGVIGIAASRTIETFYKPTVIFSDIDGQLTGSARSVKGFNIYDALKDCAPYMSRFGGHAFAAGMTLKPGAFSAFSEKFEEAVRKSIHPDALVPEIIIEEELNFQDISNRFYNTIRRFEPFGPENEAPIFLLKGVKDNGFSRILNGRHIRFEIIKPRHPGCSLVGIGFNMSEKFSIVCSGGLFDICFHIDKQVYQGKSFLQLQVLDLRPSTEK